MELEWNWNGMKFFFLGGGGRDCEENYYYNYFFWGRGWVGIVRRSKSLVGGVKRSSEVGDLRLSCKSYLWNFLGEVGIVRRIIIIIIFFFGVGGG